MRIYTSPQQALHAPADEFFRGQRVPCFENPSRARFVEQALRAAGHALRAPDSDSAPLLSQVHAPRYLDFLRTAWGQWLALDATNVQQSGRELLQPDEVRMLDNQNALLFIRGERPILDAKYDLMKHPNIRYTEDGGAGPFNYAKAPLAHDDFEFDETRYDDYELLLDEDIIGELF